MLDFSRRVINVYSRHLAYVVLTDFEESFFLYPSKSKGEKSLIISHISDTAFLD